MCDQVSVGVLVSTVPTGQTSTKMVIHLIVWHGQYRNVGANKSNTYQSGDPPNCVT